MKKILTRSIMAVIMIATLLFASIPCISAAEALDTTKKVSISLSCSKPGYTFEVFKVGTLTVTTSSPFETKYTSLVPAIDASVLSGSTANALKALDALETLPSTAVSQGTWTTSSTSTTKTFSNLAQGIYYIKATNYPAGVTSVTNSLIALPYYNNSSWVYSVSAINLASKVVDDTPTTKKEITNSTKDNVNYTDVSLGDTVNFEIKSTVAGSSSMKLGSYTVYDDMSKGLTLDKSSFNVALLNASGTKITDLDKSEYTVNVTSEADGSNTVFNVALTNAYLQTEEFYASDVTYTSVTYSAVLNKHAIVGTAGNPNTEVKLEYSNKNGVKSEIEGNTVYVYTYAITSNKTDQSGNPLANAEFSVYKTTADADANTNAIASGISDSEGKVKYLNSNGEEMKFQSGTYYVKETKAPTGYNIYDKVIKVDINATYGTVLTDGTYVTNCPENGYATFSVKNSKIVTPKTGGIGNIVFYGIGITGIVIGAVLFAVSKKKSKKNK